MANEEPTPDVLSSLPRTRPQRRSAKRDGARPAAATAAKPRTPAKPKVVAGRPKTTARARPKAAARAARAIPPAGFAPPHDTETRPAPGAAELIGTAIQAAGELAQIGLAVGEQALRSALGRRPGG